MAIYEVITASHHDSKDSTVWVFRVGYGSALLNPETYVGFFTEAGEDMVVMPDGTVENIDGPNNLDEGLVEALTAAVVENS